MTQHAEEPNSVVFLFHSVFEALNFLTIEWNSLVNAQIFVYRYLVFMVNKITGIAGGVLQFTHRFSV